MTIKVFFNGITGGLNSIVNRFFSPLFIKNYGKIGKGCIVKNDSKLNKRNLFLDDFVILQDQLNFISFTGRLYVGKYSVISSGCTIIPSSHTLTVGVPFYLSTTNHINDKDGDIIIEEDCWIGAGCILLPKCHIRRGAVVGAGSVVNKEIPPYSVVAGTPARIVATKFSIDEIIRHEKVLYPENKRLSNDELEMLFSEKYLGLKSIGTSNITEEDFNVIKQIKHSYEINDYSLLNE